MQEDVLFGEKTQQSRRDGERERIKKNVERREGEKASTVNKECSVYSEFKDLNFSLHNCVASACENRPAKRTFIILRA